MRSLSAMLGAWFALVATLACADTRWLADGEGVVQVVSNRAMRSAAIGGVQQLAATRDDGAWAMSEERLIRISPVGVHDADLDLAGNGYGLGVSLAVDPVDESAWIGTTARLLLHVSRDGALLQGTTLPGVAEWLDVGFDQTPWVVTNGQVFHVTRDGQYVEPSGVTLSARAAIRRLAVDALRGRLWISDTLGVRSIEVSPRPTTLPVSIGGRVRAMALDARSGDLWTVAGDILTAHDASGTALWETRVPIPVDDGFVTLLFDYEHEALLLRAVDTILHIALDGHIVETSTLEQGWLLATPAPIRINPTISLARPPAGGVTYDPSTQLMLRVGATCNDQDCTLSTDYVDSLRITVEVNGLQTTDASIGAAAGVAAVTPRLPMHVGPNDVKARVVDRFGHTAKTSATIRVLDHDLEIVAQSLGASVPPTENRATAAVKAANKPPGVALTSPANGATFASGATIAVAASASDPDGTIDRVEFYRSGTLLIGTATAPPYQIAWQNVAAGSYPISAKAYDNRNGTAISTSITVIVTNNQPPVVALTTPTQAAFYAPSLPIPVAAAASDPDGTVTRVEFFDRSIPIGAVTAAPFALSWANVTPGTHSLLARATDEKGGTSVSQAIDIVVGQAPLVVVTAPVACSSIDGPADVVVAADAISTTGAIARVDFFDGATLVETSYGTPWYVTLKSLAVGSHSITAVAVDDHGVVGRSRPATLTVQPANQPPTVSLTSPAEGARFALGSTVAVTASAEDRDGRVVAVEFRIGSSAGTLIGRATAPPYAVSWASMAAGNHTVVAVAIDDRNASTTSPPVHVTLAPNVPPAVTLTAPAPGTSYTAPASIALIASATDSDGSVANVDFFAGATLIASSAAAPYSVTWNVVQAGSYSVTAKAIDNSGAATLSAPVAVSVASNAPPTVIVAAPVSGAHYFAPATVPLAASASDGDGTVAKVDFYANGMLIGSATVPPYTVTWNDVGGGSYSIVATAIDDQGAATTAAPVSLTVMSHAAIEPSAGLDGSTVDDDSVVISGTITAPPNSGVLVNGVLAQLDAGGRFFANGVPLSPGANPLTIKVTSQQGDVTTAALTVSSSGPAPFAIVATPTEGLAPLRVAFELTDRANRPFDRVEFDFDGNGTVDYTAGSAQFVDGTFTLFVTYPAGTSTSRVAIYDTNEAVIQSTTRIIVSRTIQEQDILIRGMYAGMLDQLRAGRIAAALNAITGDMQDKYASVFSALGGGLPAAVDDLGTLEPNWYGADHAEYVVVRDTQDGQQAFLIDFIRGQDGIWRIHGM